MKIGNGASDALLKWKKTANQLNNQTSEGRMAKFLMTVLLMAAVAALGVKGIEMLSNSEAAICRECVTTPRAFYLRAVGGWDCSAFPPSTRYGTTYHFILHEQDCLYPFLRIPRRGLQHRHVTGA